ncbi:aspartic peptidase domain-containing protein [Chytriomyces sp. MP71]|nr:aspartic peptidase domain-containing protein [Chytriomyces sp. MP71]
MLDSGSSDLLIPGSTLPGYSGPSYDITANKTALSQTPIGGQFADSSSWSGLFFMDTVAVEEGQLGVESPFAVMMEQTVDPAVTDGSMSQGLLGIAFDSLARSKSIQYFQGPFTLLSSLVTSNALSKDMLAFRACPADSNTPSLIDWGITDASLTCPMPGTTDAVVLWTRVISKSFYQVNVTRILLNNTELRLPPTWQQNESHSIFDSCTTILQLPRSLFATLLTAIRQSNAFASSFVASGQLDLFLQRGFGFQHLPVDLHKLPTLTFELESADGVRGVRFSLPPDTYIQRTAGGVTYFTVGSLDAQGVMFGATVFDALYVVLDRGGGRVGLAPGCDCDEKIARGVPFAGVWLVEGDGSVAGDEVGSQENVNEEIVMADALVTSPSPTQVHGGGLFGFLSGATGTSMQVWLLSFVLCLLFY